MFVLLFVVKFIKMPSSLGNFNLTMMTIFVIVAAMINAFSIIDAVKNTHVDGIDLDVEILQRIIRYRLPILIKRKK